MSVNVYVFASVCGGCLWLRVIAYICMSWRVFSGIWSGCVCFCVIPWVCLCVRVFACDYVKLCSYEFAFSSVCVCLPACVCFDR